jgi:pimeloyl-ACP methyl ester carboxylesterase
VSLIRARIRRILVAGGFVAIAAASMGCGEPPLLPSITLSRCAEPDYPVDAKCTSLEVPENPEAPDGRKISLNIVVLPASGRGGDEPVFFLAGGPGQAATDLAAAMANVLPRVNNSRDFVFVDQRGTGKSNPLDCEMGQDSATEPLETEQRLDILRACLEELDADPRYYTTPIAMDDLDAVRRALAYDRINLIGSSYGTRAALVYMRRHAEAVRSVVLDAVAPMSLHLPESMAADSQRAFDLLVKACSDQPECHAAYPNFEAQFAELLESFSTPRRVSATDPSTGQVREITIDRDQIAMWVFGSLYGTNFSSLIPLAIESAHGGDWGPFAALLSNTADLGDSLSYGMRLSVVCAEDIPFIDNDANTYSDTFLGDYAVREMVADCGVWPRGDIPDGYHEAVQSDIPTLVLSGDLDPVTPPRWGEQAARSLSRSKHVVLAGVGHGVEMVPCGSGLIEDFIKNPNIDELDVECAASSTRPAIFASTVGAVPLAEPSNDSDRKAP